AVWQHLLEEEATDLFEGPEGQAVATILFDLVKCFERVQLKHVWAWGVRWGFPRRVLRMLLVSHSAVRTIAVEGAHSRTVQVISAIVPDSRFAIAALHLVLLEPCDALASRWPQLGLGKYVDDITVRARGNARQVVDDMADGAQWFVRTVESTSQLEVSMDQGEVPGKSVGLATSAWVGHRLGIHMEQQASQLGIDRKGWKGRGLEAARARRRLSSRRPARDRPQRAGRFRVLAERRRLVVKAKRWGARVLLVSKEVAQLRSNVNAALPGRSRHRSTTLRLACFGEDPGPALTSAPIAAWAEHVWDHPGPSSTMSEAWKRQQIRLLHDESQSARMGPAFSCVLAARRLGWTWPSWRTFVSREGHIIDLAAVCPRDVQAMAERDAELQQWEALQKWFRRWQRRWCAGASAAARSVSAGAWTQSRAWQAGAATLPWCQLCLADGREFAGTPKHRWACCPGLRRHREALPPRWQHMMATSSDRWLWDRALLPHPGLRRPFQAQALEEHWEGEDCYLTGDVGTDGSLKGRWKWLGPGGWAAVMMDPEGAVVQVAAWGPLPQSLPVHRNIDRAELQAIERALAHALPPLVLHVDRQSVLDGVAAGERWCTASRRPNADLWRQVWARLRDIGLGPNGVQFRKVKAHRSAAVVATLDCEQQRIAQVNKAADERAGRGAECGTNVMLQYVDEACHAAAEKIHYVLNYQAELTTRVLYEHSRWPDVQELPKSRQGAPPSIQLVPDPAQAHDIQRRPGGRWECVRCHRRAPLQVLRDECCRGHIAANLPIVFTTAGAVSNGHRLWRTSTWIWRQRCGQHAQRTRTAASTHSDAASTHSDAASVASALAAPGSRGAW
ncbi:unnamed protein product, partial [Prorocentrum cordatum]